MSTHGIMMYRVFSGYLLTVLLVPSVAHMPARLIGGTADEGRLEILYNGTWSTVCDDKFGQEEALVACRMLGYNSTTAVPVGSPKYGGGYGLILLDDLECDGNETSLTQCKHSGLYTHNCDHSEDVGVMCNLSAWPSLQQMSARVVDGTSDSGRLEIFYHGTWSTVCDDGFGQEDALVACRMLGFNSTTAIPVGSYKYGEGLGPILLDEVECQGNETSLAQCKHSGFYIHGCGHPDDVGVICNINLIIARLVDGTSEAGRLELFVNEEWGTVCGKNFGRKEALVACRMLGFNSSNTTATAVSSFKYGDGSGDILLFDLKCTRTESSLVQCSNAVFYTNICEHSQDVGIICNANPVIARLVNGTSEAGRLELLVNGEWGTVCNDGFDQKDAQVACRMLGFNSTAIIATAVTSSKYGQGSGDILLSDLNCGGSETSLEECSHEGFYYSYCDHSKDVGIICNVSPIIARVADGTSEAGRLELFFNGEWSTVCNKQFGRKNAQVACRMLGFNSTSTNVAVVSSSKYGHGSGNILLYNLNCHGTETSLEQCSQRGFYNKHCSHSEDVGIICNIIEQMRARLVNGTSAAGRLEIFFNGEWGTVCSGISFQTKEAQVACRMLGYNSTGAAIIDTEKYGQGAGPVLLQNMFYKGTESSLDQCSIELYSRNCDHENDAGVICNIMSGDQLAARLVNGTSEGGRLEIFFDGEWGTVCDWRFGNKEAEVACRMLGFKSNGAAAISSDKYGEGAGHVLLQNVKCQGTEYSLEQCKLGLLYSRQCDHKQDVGVICNITSPLTARLYGGTSEAGRLQIDFNGEWSTVCHSAVNQNEIEVACKILGFNSSGQAAVKSLRFGDGSGFKISYMKCRGMETSLEQCEFGQLHKTSCFDVGILCDVRNFSLLLTGPRRTSSNTGRVEVKIGSEHLSTVCVKDEKTAAVICRQLNLPLNVAALIDGWSVGGKKSPVLEASFVCDGNEKNLLECGRNKSTGDCYSDDVGVVCSKHNQLYIVSEAEMYPFMEGAKGALMCAKSRNYPQALEYTWASKADGRPQGNLLFYDNLTREYNGRKVSCQAYISDNAYNVDELLQSDTLELNIYYKPLIKLKWADNTGTRQPVSNLSELNPGQNVTLWCEADSNPLPASITWSGRVNSTTGELRIIAAEHVTHSGLYTCTVVTQTVDDDDRLPLRSSYQLTLSVQAEEEASSTTKPSDTAVIAGAAVAGAAVVGLSASSSLLFWKKRKRQRLLAEQEKHRNEGGSFRPLHEPEEEETYVDIEDVADEPAVGEEYGYSEIDDGTGRGRRHKPPLPQRDAQRTGIEDPYDQAISSSEDVRPGTSRGSKKTTKKVSLNLHGTEIPYGVCKDTEQQQSSSETSSEDSPASSSPSSKGNESESYTYPGSQHGKKEDYLTPAPSSPGAEQTGSRSLATAAVRNADDYLTPTSADSKGRTQVVTAEVTRADDYLTPTSDTGGGAMTVAADGVRRADDYLTPTSNTSTEGRQAVTTPDYYLTPISGDTVEGSLANDYFTPATEKSGEGSTTPGVADDKQAHIYTPLLPQPQFVLSEEMKKAGYLTPVHIPTTPDTQETDSTISDRKKAGYLTPVEVPGSPELGSKSQERSAPSQDIKKPQDYLTPVSSSSSSSVAAPAKKKKEKSSMIPLAEFWSSKRLSSQRKSPPSSEGETEATHTYEKMGNVKYTEPGNDPAYTKIGEVPVTVSTDPDSYQNC